MLGNFSSAPLPKRKRLSYACNYCRAKKTRCDEQFPSCRNCRLAGVPCITVDKRRPNAPVQNRRKDLPATGQPISIEATRVTVMASPETTDNSRPSSLVTPEFTIAPTLSRSPSPVPRGSNDWPNWDTKHLPVIPSQAGSSVVQISIQWLDLALARLRIPRSSYVRANLSPCLSGPTNRSEYAVPSLEPGLPPLDELHRLTELFFKVYHPIYPFLDRQKIFSLFDESSVISPHHGRTCRFSKVSRLMILHLITILGTMAGPTVSQQYLNTSLGYCHSLVGHLILQPSIESVQTLLLFSITLRLRDQLSQAWDVLALSISMSQTLRLADLNFHLQALNGSILDSDMGSARTWWALYVFEKFLAFDSGRRSNLDDTRLSSVGRQAPTEPLDRGRVPELQDYKHYLTSLANVLREMQHRSWHTWRTESLDTSSEADARASKIRAAGAIDTLLWKWRGSLPPEYQVGTPSSADVQLMPQWAFLSFYYHQATIVLYRNTQLLDWNEVKAEVDRYGSGEPWHLRLRNGPQICLEAVKDMTNLQVMVTEAGVPSFLTLSTSPLAAAFVLAIHISRQPASILSRTHSELMKVAMAISRQRYSSSTGESQLNKSLDALEQYVIRLLGDPASQSSVEFNPESVEINHTTMPIANIALSTPLEPSPLTWSSFELLSWDWNELIPQA
ncbi:hypothetical protein BJX63DRAFT_433284 [Aspergillus granulosus]|uniref:Zn(2)-C6 fungal-type domain-containing protein n=1 Tax=Aspergillus granulosus TaxID=176169 RepID=A0ABR4H831_9EURO